MSIFTLIAFIFSSKLINWEKVPKILWAIQFPWRNCTFIALGISAIAGIAINQFKGESKKIMFILICIICLMDVNNTMRKETLRILKPVTSKEVADVKGRAMEGQKEYLPVKVAKHIEYLKNRNQKIIVKERNAKIEVLKNKTPYLQFNVNVEENSYTTLEIPRIFYYGYEIRLEKDDGKKKKIDYYENENGFIEFKINEKGNITVDYRGTILNRFSNAISVTLIILFLLYTIRKEKQYE